MTARLLSALPPCAGQNSGGCYNHVARKSGPPMAGSRPTRRGGRVAEGGGLLNRYTVKSCIGGSNPPLSARLLTMNELRLMAHRRHEEPGGALLSP